ncbi:MAG: type II toxin-antitoxin system PemK/MazF family toxin [Oscillospiraceae bacterium]|nr:type II toxin-antitoxin system PemK/MazF family toxin [Oscillospiraceae bacterium]
MILEIWYYKANLPSSNKVKARPVLIVGDDRANGLQVVDIHYCIISSSSAKGDYDVEINEEIAKEIGLARASIIKTTKIYTGSKHLLERKVCDLPDSLRDEFVKRFKDYQGKMLECIESIRVGVGVGV